MRTVGRPEQMSGWLIAFGWLGDGHSPPPGISPASPSPVIQKYGSELLIFPRIGGLRLETALILHSLFINKPRSRKFRSFG